MNKSDKAFHAHLDAIRAGEVTKTNVIGLRKTLNAAERISAGYSVSITTPKAAYDHDALADMTQALHDLKPRIVGALHDSGVKMLQSKRYAKQLANYADIIAELDHFRLVGFEMIGSRLMKAFPVYRAYARNGTSFAFYVIPWQSGGNGPEITFNY